MEVDNYIQYMETAAHGQTDIPFNNYLCTIPLDFPSVKLHWHDQMEIIYIKKGYGCVSVNMNPMQVSSGAIIPILPGELHSIAGTQGDTMEYENMIFSLSLLDSGAPSDWIRTNILDPIYHGSFHFPRPIVPDMPLYEEVSSSLNAIDDVCRDLTGAWSLLVKASLLRLFHALYNARTTEEEKKASPHAEVIKTAIQLIHDRYRERITIQDAADAAGFSVNHFMRIFKEETGETFLQALNDYRLEMACYLMNETSCSVSNAAIDSGFDNFSYFIRLFTRRYGTTPGRWRRQKRAVSAQATFHGQDESEK